MRHLFRFVLPAAVLVLITGMLPVIPTGVSGDSQLAQVLGNEGGNSVFQQRQEEARAGLGSVDFGVGTGSGLTTGGTTLTNNNPTYYQVLIPGQTTGRPTTGTGTGVGTGSVTGSGVGAGSGTGSVTGGTATTGSGSSGATTQAGTNTTTGGSLVGGSSGAGTTLNTNTGSGATVGAGSNQQTQATLGQSGTANQIIQQQWQQQQTQVTEAQSLGGFLSTSGNGDLVTESEILKSCLEIEGANACIKCCDEAYEFKIAACSNGSIKGTVAIQACQKNNKGYQTQCQAACSKRGSGGSGGVVTSVTGSSGGSTGQVVQGGFQVWVQQDVKLVSLATTDTGSGISTNNAPVLLLPGTANVSLTARPGYVAMQVAPVVAQATNVVKISQTAGNSTKVETAGDLLAAISKDVLNQQEIKTTSGAIVVVPTRTTGFSVITTGFTSFINEVSKTVTGLMNSAGSFFGGVFNLGNDGGIGDGTGGAGGTGGTGGAGGTGATGLTNTTTDNPPVTGGKSRCPSVVLWSDANPGAAKAAGSSVTGGAGEGSGANSGPDGVIGLTCAGLCDDPTQTCLPLKNQKGFTDGTSFAVKATDLPKGVTVSPSTGDTCACQSPTGGDVPPSIPVAYNSCPQPKGNYEDDTKDEKTASSEEEITVGKPTQGNAKDEAEAGMQAMLGDKDCKGGLYEQKEEVEGKIKEQEDAVAKLKTAAKAAGVKDPDADVPARKGPASPEEIKEAKDKAVVAEKAQQAVLDATRDSYRAALGRQSGAESSMNSHFVRDSEGYVVEDKDGNPQVKSGEEEQYQKDKKDAATAKAEVDAIEAQRAAAQKASADAGQAADLAEKGKAQSNQEVAHIHYKNALYDLIALRNEKSDIEAKIATLDGADGSKADCKLDDGAYNSMGDAQYIATTYGGDASDYQINNSDGWNSNDRIQATDAAGNPVTDKNGNPVYETEKDENGNDVKDENGNSIYRTQNTHHDWHAPRQDTNGDGKVDDKDESSDTNGDGTVDDKEADEAKHAAAIQAIERIAAVMLKAESDAAGETAVADCIKAALAKLPSPEANCSLACDAGQTKHPAEGKTELCLACGAGAPTSETSFTTPDVKVTVTGEDPGSISQWTRGGKFKVKVEASTACTAKQ